jgi:predicted NUDIX family NTP pyrophosphohydrolase
VSTRSTARLPGPWHFFPNRAVFTHRAQISFPAARAFQLEDPPGSGAMNEFLERPVDRT